MTEHRKTMISSIARAFLKDAIIIIIFIIIIIIIIILLSLLNQKGDKPNATYKS